MNAFCDNITSASSRITKSNKFRYLRKLQILTCWEEIEKVKKSQQRKSAEAESSFFMMKWITNLLKSGKVLYFPIFKLIISNISMKQLKYIN